MNKPVFILSFLKRYWKLLIVFVILVLLGKVDQVTYFVGPIFYLVEMLIGSIVAAIFVRHAFFTQTLDAFSQQGLGGIPSDFENAWLKITEEQRLRLSLFMLAVFFLGACWIAASLAK